MNLTEINAELMASMTTDTPLPSIDDHHPPAPAIYVQPTGDAPVSDVEAAAFMDDDHAERLAVMCIAAVLDYGGSNATKRLRPEHMPTRELAEVYRMALANADRGIRGVIDGVQAMIAEMPPESFASMQGAICALTETPIAAHPAIVEPAADQLVRRYAERRRWELACRIIKAAETGEDARVYVDELASLDDHATSTSIHDQLAARAFDANDQPPPPVPVLSLGDKIIATPGNLLNIQAPAKAGKSAALAGMLAAMFRTDPAADCLGFVADNPRCYAVVHFDTEQSRYDHDALIRRALRRSMAHEVPGWFYSWSIADMGHDDRLAAWREGIKLARRQCGGVYAVFLDGVADLCRDPNDAEEAFDLVASLHALAIRMDCAIITVLHENPGSEIGKTRGHLGSQIERKAETNLRLAKDAGGVTTIWTERARHGHIPRDQGACFEWSDAAGMHVSCGSAAEIKAATKRNEMEEQAAQVMLRGKGKPMTHAEAVGACEDVLGVSQRTAKRRIAEWKNAGIVIQNEAGKYETPV